MKPDVIDNELWDDIYDTYVADKHNLGTKDYFKSVNPAAIQEITAVMLETARKGMWEASPEQLSQLAELHTEIVEEFGPACSGFVCDNAKLRDFISSKVNKESADKYRNAVAEVRAEAVNGNDGMVMKKETLSSANSVNTVNGIIVGVAVIVALIAFGVIIRRRRKMNNR